MKLCIESQKEAKDIKTKAETKIDMEDRFDPLLEKHEFHKALSINLGQYIKKQ